MNKIFVMFKIIISKCKDLLILGRYNNLYGAFLLMWPCYWGVLSDVNSNENLFSSLFLFSLGSVVMRGAGCCINDIFDRKYDKKVERTKNRPLATGKINIYEAITFIFFQLLIGLLVVIQFNATVIIWSFFVIPLVVVYPLLKRITHFPQVVLGLAFNWGVIVGSLNQNENINYSIFYLYLAGVFLTIAYDTIYGFQDIDDDKDLGLRSLAILLENKQIVIFYLYMISSLFFLTFFLINFNNKIASLICGLVIFIIFFYQYFSFRKKKSLLKIFQANVLNGGIISTLVLIQNYL